MAKLTFNDIMTKLSNVFKSDLYILNSKFCVGGDTSEEKNMSLMLCLLNEECEQILKELFPDTDVVYIKDVKKVKNDFDNFISLKIFDSEKEKIINQRNKVYDMVLKVDSWKTFNFTEEDIKKIFDDRMTYELFKDDDNIPSVTVSKSIFPMTKEKTIDSLYYSVFLPKSDDELINLVTSFDTEWFQIYSLIQYIKTE